MPINIFKPHIITSIPYKGGSTREEPSIRKIYKLSSNDNLLGSSPKAIRAIQENLDQLQEYQFQGDEALRNALARHARFELSPVQFICANSGMELLDIICRGFLDPDMNAILSSPTFMAYKSFANLSGARLIDVPLIPNTFQLNVAGILSAIRDKTRIVFLASPNNPTGTIIPKMVTNDLIRHLPAHMILVYDEVYHDYVDRPDYASALGYIMQGKNVIGLHMYSVGRQLKSICLHRRK
jgi:histidinol-phosphate aminotransferase